MSHYTCQMMLVYMYVATLSVVHKKDKQKYVFPVYLLKQIAVTEKQCQHFARSPWES